MDLTSYSPAMVTFARPWPTACTLVTLLAGCPGGPGQPLFKRAAPLITLRIGVYADPGYQSSGLYAQYERLHPDIRIVQADTAARPAPQAEAPPRAERFSDARSRRRPFQGASGPGPRRPARNPANPPQATPAVGAIATTLTHRACPPATLALPSRRTGPNLDSGQIWKRFPARTRGAPTRLPGPPCPLRQPDPRGGCGCEG